MSCNNCGKHNCSCGSRTKYNECCSTATICPDDVVQVHHGDVTIQGNSSPVLIADRSFSIPACNEQGKISVAGEVPTPPSGSQVYVAKDGQVAFLTVIAATRFYAEDQTNCSSSCSSTGSQGTPAHRTELTILNQCLSCTTLAVGTFLDQGSPLLITAPDCAVTTSGSSDLVLCDKLHVPEIGESETILVSPSTSSLSIGDIVQITDKKFEIVSIPDATTIEIRNLGEGGAPGTIIDGCDCLSVRIFVIAGENPCAKDPVLEADFVRVCDGGNDTILDIEDGQVVGKVNGRVVGVDLPESDRVAVDFSGCVTLNPSIDPQEYPVILSSTDAPLFPVGSVVYFDCDTVVPPRRFVVNDQGATTLLLEPLFDVTAVGAIGDCDDCQLVMAECCEALENQLCDIKKAIHYPTAPLIVRTTPGVLSNQALPNNIFDPVAMTGFVTTNTDGTATRNDYDSPEVVEFCNPFEGCTARVHIVTQLAITFANIPAGTQYEYDILFGTTIAGLDLITGPFYGAAATGVVVGGGSNWGTTQQLEYQVNIDLADGECITREIMGRIRVSVPNGGSVVINMPFRVIASYYPTCPQLSCD